MFDNKNIKIRVFMGNKYITNKFKKKTNITDMYTIVYSVNKNQLKHSYNSILKNTQGPTPNLIKNAKYNDKKHKIELLLNKSQLYKNKKLVVYVLVNIILNTKKNIIELKKFNINWYEHSLDNHKHL